MVNFIHFGCWNNIKGNTIGMMNFVKKYIEGTPVDFISIAGDNYYPQKITKDGLKMKIFHEDNFKSGFDILNSIDVKKYLVFGNHDITDFHNCDSLIKQLEYKNFSIFNGMNSHIYDDMIVFFLDSTVFELLEFKDSRVNDSCYRLMFPQLENLSDIVSLQRQYIIDTINSNNCKNIMFVFHHPLIAGHMSNSKGTVKISYLPKMKEFYLSLYDSLIDKNIYHLCADTHYYQKGTIKISNEDKELNIIQYIVGTGGTILDEMYSEEIEHDNISFTPIETIVSYGFIHIMMKDKIVIDFINFDEDRYKKYKLKYLKLKSKFI